MDELQCEHKHFSDLKSYLYATTNKVASPVVEAELEEIVRCAFAGGYRFDIEKIAMAHGAFTIGYSIDGVVLKPNQSMGNG